MIGLDPWSDPSMLTCTWRTVSIPAPVPDRPNTLPILMMRPPSVICRAATWEARNTARTSIAQVRSSCSTYRVFSGSAGKDPGVVDQDVDPAQVLHGLVDRRHDGTGVGAIGLDDERSPTSGFDPLGNLLRLVSVVGIREGHCSAIMGQPQGGCRSNSTTAPVTSATLLSNSYMVTSVLDRDGEMVHLTRNLNPRFDQAYATARLSEVGIPLDRKAGKLSGGQQAQLALGPTGRGSSCSTSR